MDQRQTISNNIHILLIEPEAAYGLLFRSALDEVKANYTLVIVKTGLEALDYIESSYKQRIHFIITDLGIGDIDGYYIITYAKKHISFLHTPVIVLGVNDQESICEAYNRFANAYITKPNDKDQYKSLIQQIWYFWASVTTLSNR